MKKVLFLLLPVLIFLSCLNFQLNLKSQSEQYKIHRNILENKEEKEKVFTSLLACIQTYNYFNKIKDVPDKINKNQFSIILKNISCNDDREFLEDYYELIDDFRINRKFKYDYRLNFYKNFDSYDKIQRTFLVRKKISDILIEAGYLKSKYDNLKDHPLLRKYEVPICFLSSPENRHNLIKKQENFGLIYIPKKDEKTGIRENKIIIAFRGSVTNRDWLLNVYFSNSSQYAMTYIDKYRKIDENIYKKIPPGEEYNIIRDFYTIEVTDDITGDIIKHCLNIESDNVFKKKKEELDKGKNEINEKLNEEKNKKRSKEEFNNIDIIREIIKLKKEKVDLYNKMFNLRFELSMLNPVIYNKIFNKLITLKQNKNDDNIITIKELRKIEKEEKKAGKKETELEKIENELKKREKYIDLFPEIKVENGFYITYNFFSDNLNDILKDINNIKNNNSKFNGVKDISGNNLKDLTKDDNNDKFINENTKIYITGHSLGSISAYLFALEFINKNHDFYDNKPEKLDNIHVITFASPRPGNQEFTDLFSEKIKNSIRFVNCLDSVTQLPMSNTFGYNYEHVNHEYCLLFAPDRKHDMSIVIPSNKMDIMYSLATIRFIATKAECHYQENYYQALENIFLNPENKNECEEYGYGKYPDLYRDILTIIQPPVSNNYLFDIIDKDLFEKKFSKLSDKEDREFLMEYYNYDALNKNYVLNKKTYIDHKIEKDIFERIKNKLKGIPNSEFIINKFKSDISENYYILNNSCNLKEKIDKNDFLQLTSLLDKNERLAINKYFKLNKIVNKYSVDCKKGISPEIREKIFRLLDLDDLKQLDDLNKKK